jgi:hypothetical protein
LILKGALFHAAFVVAALSTIVIEVFSAVLILRLKKVEVPLGRAVGVVFLANAVTLPSIWYVPYVFFPSVLGHEHLLVYTLTAESLVFLAEAAVYYFLLTGRRLWLALALSAFSNAASLTMGYFVGRAFIRLT